MVIDIEQKFKELPKKCITVHCYSKDFYQDHVGQIYCEKCGAYLGLRQPGLLPFKVRDDNVIP